MKLRYDTFFTRLGDRAERPYNRLWIEDSFGRLTANGFATGTGFAARQRPGVGLVLSPDTLGACHVSQRRGAAILSYEARGLTGALRTSDVRVRVCVKSIVVMPCLRLFHVGRGVNGEWSIAENRLHADGSVIDIATSTPLQMRKTPAVMSVALTEANIVFATEIIGNTRPAAVRLSGDRLLVTVAEQFLAAAGYAQDGDAWRR